jgi:hypothetical protein
MEWKRKKRPRVLRGGALNPLYRLETRDLDMSGSRAGYVRAIGRTCPVKTASVVLETSELSKKLIFNGFWRRANIIYICVWHMDKF